jgi:hypothetical protein
MPEHDWPESDLWGYGHSGTNNAFATAVTEQDKCSWTGIHRYDPAVEVPRPTGVRWLIPPIMYRTGWATRVLSGALLLLLVLVATAFTVGLIRGHDSERTTSPNVDITENQNPDSDDYPNSDPTSTESTTLVDPSRTTPAVPGAPVPSVAPDATNQPEGSHRSPAAPVTTARPEPTFGGGQPTCTGLVCVTGPNTSTTPRDCTRGCPG